MLDRVKESLFNILRQIVVDATVLDLFSGSGGLGLEALSRGARSCVFVEQDDRLARLIERNAEKCHLASKCRVLRADVLQLAAAEPQGDDLPADLVFVDPPYAYVDDPNRRAELFGALDGMAGKWFAEGADVALHHRPIPYALWPTSRLSQWDKRIYGRSQLTFFEVLGQ